jgi:hypothetical protein
VTPETYRVLRAVGSAERGTASAVLPLRRIARDVLGGDDQRAAKILAALDLEGCVRTDTMGWHSGWLTPKGRSMATTPDAA